MIDLRDYFERVYVINLKRRPDRLWAIRNAMERCKWPFREPIIYPAIDGDKVGVPVEFTQGGGAYGCRLAGRNALVSKLKMATEHCPIGRW